MADYKKFPLSLTMSVAEYKQQQELVHKMVVSSIEQHNRDLAQTLFRQVLDMVSAVHRQDGGGGSLVSGGRAGTTTPAPPGVRLLLKTLELAVLPKKTSYGQQSARAWTTDLPLKNFADQHFALKLWDHQGQQIVQILQQSITQWPQDTAFMESLCHTVSKTLSLASVRELPNHYGGNRLQVWNAQAVLRHPVLSQAVAAMADLAPKLLLPKCYDGFGEIMTALHQSLVHDNNDEENAVQLLKKFGEPLLSTGTLLASGSSSAVLASWFGVLEKTLKWNTLLQKGEQTRLAALTGLAAGAPNNDASLPSWFVQMGLELAFSTLDAADVSVHELAVAAALSFLTAFLSHNDKKLPESFLALFSDRLLSVVVSRTIPSAAAHLAINPGTPLFGKVGSALRAVLSWGRGGEGGENGARNIQIMGRLEVLFGDLFTRLGLPAGEGKRRCRDIFTHQKMQQGPLSWDAGQHLDQSCNKFGQWLLQSYRQHSAWRVAVFHSGVTGGG